MTHLVHNQKIYIYIYGNVRQAILRGKPMENVGLAHLPNNVDVVPDRPKYLSLLFCCCPARSGSCSSRRTSIEFSEPLDEPSVCGRRHPTTKFPDADGWYDLEVGSHGMYDSGGDDDERSGANRRRCVSSILGKGVPFRPACLGWYPLLPGSPSPPPPPPAVTAVAMVVAVGSEATPARRRAAMPAAAAA